MSAFTNAASALFRNTDMAVDVTYHPGGLPVGVSVRAVLSRGDRDAEWQDTRLRAASTFLSVQIADCPDLAIGDIFVINGAQMRVKGSPERDALRITWRAEMEASKCGLM